MQHLPHQKELHLTIMTNSLEIRRYYGCISQYEGF